tara:strand:- start:1495 stop:2400 length:906 start_codon:yes stop_codon:yes gene_type:complete
MARPESGEQRRERMSPENRERQRQERQEQKFRDRYKGFSEGELAQARSAEEMGLEGPQVGQFLSLGMEADRLRGGTGERSLAAEDILRQQRELAGAQMGIAAGARGRFAGATRSQAQRGAGQSMAMAQAQAAAADQARLRQIQDMRKQLQTTGQIQQYQEEKAREQLRQERNSMLGGGFGALAGAALPLALMNPLGLSLPVAASLMAASGQFGGGLGQMVSDEKMKSNVKDGNAKTRKMLDGLSAKEYDIDGERDYGVMAQDMPKDMVKEVGGVKTIPEGFGKLLAGMANLNDRIKKLEGK